MSWLITQDLTTQINTHQHWFFSFMMCSLEDSIPPGKSSTDLWIPPSFCFLSFKESRQSSSSSPSLCSEPPHQSALPLFIFFCLSSSVPLFRLSHVSPQLLLYNISVLLLLLLPPPPPCRRVSAPPHPKRQPLRVETGQRGQWPVGEADGPMCGPPQVSLNHVSSQDLNSVGFKAL